MSNFRNGISEAFLALVESSLRNIGSPVGIKLRQVYYKQRFKACGRNIRIDCGVHIMNPAYISIGDNVFFDKGVIIIAGPAGDRLRTKRVPNTDSELVTGEIVIGSNSHIGIGTIIQGHGGIVIGECFTTSSRCMIYTLSNDPWRCRAGTVGGAANDVHYVETPVAIGRNVWLGLQTIVIGGTIGDDVFVKPNSVVVSSIEANRIAQGQPARAVQLRFGLEAETSECAGSELRDETRQ